VRLPAAAPHRLLEAVADAVRTQAPGARCRLLLADHRMDVLRSADGVEVPVDGDAPGRCFAAQRPALARDGAGPRSDDALLAPVSLHGDRIGVLEVAPGLAVPDDAAALDGVRALGELLGQALLAADLVTDAYRVLRRGRSLTLSAEMQWDLLPGRSLDAGFVAVAAQLEPAYSVVGDAYDWAVDGEGLTAVLVDGAGPGWDETADGAPADGALADGAPAGRGPGSGGTAVSGAAALAVAALRNGRREGVDLAGLARLADAALHARHAGRVVTSAVLLRLRPDAARVRLEAIGAGGGTVLHAGRHGVRVLDLGSDPPFGAEEDYPYRVAAALALDPGDRVVAVSDGLASAPGAGDEPFAAGLADLLPQLRLLGAAELVRAVIRGLRQAHDGRPLQDDAVVLCLDVPLPPA